MALKRLAFVILAAAALGACGTGEAQKSAVNVVKAAISGGQKPSVKVYPRSEIVKAGKPVLYVGVPAQKLDSLMLRGPVRGDVVNWVGGDGSSITLRDGVLLQTRGLAMDLMSSSVPSAAQILRGGSYKRVYYPIAAEDKTPQLAYECSSAQQGREAITIFGRTHETTKVVENCQGTADSVKNEYWFEGGKIRQSKQFVHPSLGKLELAHVVD